MPAPPFPAVPFPRRALPPSRHRPASPDRAPLLPHAARPQSPAMPARHPSGRPPGQSPAQAQPGPPPVSNSIRDTTSIPVATRGPAPRSPPGSPPVLPSAEQARLLAAPVLLLGYGDPDPALPPSTLPPAARSRIRRRTSPSLTPSFLLPA